MRLSGPLSVLIEVNSLCQLCCRYCSAQPFNGSQLPKERTISLIQELGKFPVWATTFSGGEPLLHPHILTFVESSFHAGIRPTINTNGLKLLDPQTLKGWVQLKEHNIEFTLSISIDSPYSQDNDSARGRGVDVIRAIHAALREGLDVTLSTVVHKGNLGSAMLIPEAFPEVRQVHFSPVVARHLHPAIAADLAVGDDDMEKFWQGAARLQHKLGQSRILLPFRVPSEEGDRAIVHREHTTCFCGFTSCIIDSQFNVYPCDWARVPSVWMGSIATNSLRSIWKGQRADCMRALALTERLCLMEAQQTMPLEAVATT